MSQPTPHRKRVKHYHEPGDFHELTFSCYRRMRLLTNDPWREYLARSIDDARVFAHRIRVHAGTRASARVRHAGGWLGSICWKWWGNSDGAIAADCPQEI